MSRSQKILLYAGAVLSILAMAYGVWYAVVDEHPTLERMGVSLASAFAEVANGNMDRAGEFLAAYGDTRFEYMRDVHTHSHLAALGTLLLALGLLFGQVAFPERIRSYLAILLVFGSFALPMGSFLEMFQDGVVPTAVAAFGALALIAGLAATAAGLMSAYASGRA